MCLVSVSPEPSLLSSSSLGKRLLHTVEGLSRSHCSPSTPTSLAEEGPRRDQTVRQPHSRRMRHTWEVTCLAQPTCGHSSLTDPQADLGSRSLHSLCNCTTCCLRVLTYNMEPGRPASCVAVRTGENVWEVLCRGPGIWQVLRG